MASRPIPTRRPVYDRAEIAGCVREMTRHDHDREDWFTQEGLEPLRLTYDALAADPLATPRRLLDRLGLDSAAAEGVEPGVRKLADDVSRDWVARLRAEAGIA